MKDFASLPLTCAHWGTYRARVGNGRVQELLAFEHDADPSPIGSGILNVQDGPTRIDAPMVRKSWLEGGPGVSPELRGIDPFVAVSWDEVNARVAGELDRVCRNYGNRAIFGGSYGWASAGRFHHAQSQLHRFLNCIGGYTRSRFTYSFAAAEAMVPHVLGSFRAFLDTCSSWSSIRAHTGLMVCFGGVPLKNGQISPGGTGCHVQREELEAAGAAGIRFVNVTPMKSDLLDDLGGDWLALRPNTDTALMLGLAHTLQTEGLTDHDFIDRYTTGFDQFLPYLVGKTDGVAKSAAWAAEITGIQAGTIRALARSMAANRTMISVSWSLTRQDHGEQPFWAAITLAAMLGQIGLPGGGIGFGYSAMNFVGGQFTIPPTVSFPQGKNPVEAFIPVARITDLLTRPGEFFEFDGGQYEFPEIKIVWWAGGNPFHHHQDLNRLNSAWKKPDTVIVNEWCWNALAKRADIVLPCTTPLERQDMAMTPRDPYLFSMTKLTEPVGLARDDHEIFAGIAGRLGLRDAFTEGRSAEDWQRWIWDKSRERCAAVGVDIPDYDTFRKNGWYRIDDPAEPLIMMQAFRENPEANPLATPSGKIEIFSKTVAAFGYEDCPGHPVWLEPYEWLGNADLRWPLHLISNQPKDKLHSQFDHGGVSKNKKIKGREPVQINPRDAAARGLENGDIVRIFNARGACLAGVDIDPAIRPSVLNLSTGAWYDPEDPGQAGSPCKHGNPNVLTRDKGTSRLGQGPTAHTCMVEVERFDGALPPVTAHDPPEIIRSKPPTDGTRSRACDG